MCRYLIKLVCRFELNSSMNHSFHLMKKNVVYLDWSEKQNLSTLRKTYADDNNVVSSLRSLTTYHRQRDALSTALCSWFFCFILQLSKILWRIFRFLFHQKKISSINLMTNINFFSNSIDSFTSKPSLSIPTDNSRAYESPNQSYFISRISNANPCELWLSMKVKIEI